jgi:hypothetical protein
MNGGLFGDIRYCIFDIVIGLNCFYDNEELLFPEAPTDCFIDIPVSVENILPEDISIYPNPISDQLNIKHGSTELEKISILNLSGIEIYEGPNTASVDVSSLAPGAYILLLQSTDGRTFTQNLIKLN